MTLGLGLVVMLVQYCGFRDGGGTEVPATHSSAWTLWITMPSGLRALLAVDCLVRIGEGIAASFIVLFVIQTRGFSAADFGVFYAIQHIVSIAGYLPGARIAGVTGRAPVVALTFVFFALFPLSVRLASSYHALAAAFVIGGLKEIGEPARKSLILDFAPDDRRAATVGVYYSIRNLLVVPAGLIGGLLWQRAPHLPLETAFAVSAIGVMVFLIAARRAILAH